MKVTATKDFGATTKKPLLPLVPEPTTISKKEDLATLDLLTDPTNVDSVKIKFAFKRLTGGGELPRQVIQWRANVERALNGLHDATGLTHYQLVQQFCNGTALATFNTHIVANVALERTIQVALQNEVIRNDDGTDADRAARLAVRLNELTTGADSVILSIRIEGIKIVARALNAVVNSLLPSKTLQRVKRYLRREARKPADMTVRAYFMHILRINNEEIPRLPPNFNATARLGVDELVDILLFGTPKSWQREMDRQGFDPLTCTPDQVVAFMEQIETSEDFDGDKKNTTTVSTKKGTGKKKAGTGNNNANSDGFYCIMHGKNTSHDTNDCTALKAHVKKTKTGTDANTQKGKGKNKTWKNKSEKETTDSKKELAALTKQVKDLSKKIDLNVIEPVKKRKVKWPTAEDEQDTVDLAAIDKELKDFNYGDLDKMDINEEADEKEDGEVEIDDEVSV